MNNSHSLAMKAVLDNQGKHLRHNEDTNTDDVLENFLEKDDRHVEWGSRTLLHKDLRHIDLVGTGGSRTKSSLFPLDQAFIAFLDPGFQDF